MSKIFISYRRDDSKDITKDIYNQLSKVFGEENLFLDVDNIYLGQNIGEVITGAIAPCHIVLVIIGQKWLTITDEVGRRLDNPNDFVRLEVETALSLDKIVIPVLVDGASRPTADNLPQSIAKLAGKSTAIMGGNLDIERLIKEIKSYGRRSKQNPKLEAFATEVSKIIGDPFEWCDVPEGLFVFGEGEEKQTLGLPQFAIAQNPITYNQFQHFINAQDGFYNSQGWKGLAASKEHKEKPNEQVWPIARHPRETDNWYQAIAFCRWLSYRLGGTYDLERVAEWPVRLPTEAEWEKAARGVDGYIYPWGNTFDSSKCNTSSHINQTTPVDKYLDGASPYGVSDMIGNVWEWCLDEWLDPHNLIYYQVLAQNVNMKNDNYRVLRGGSWDNKPIDAAYRDILPTVTFSSECKGFRICTSILE